MEIQVRFYSYFRDLTGCEGLGVTVAAGSTLGELHEQLMVQFPKLGLMRRSTLLAVGVSYQSGDYVLRAGEEVSLFPPVQGG